MTKAATEPATQLFATPSYNAIRKDQKMFDVKYPSTFHLRKGAGRGDPANGLCFMETAAYIMGEPITDHPECACPVLTSYGIFLNDSMPDDARQYRHF